MYQTKREGNAEPLVAYMTKHIFQLHTALIMKVLPIQQLETSHRKHSHFRETIQGETKQNEQSDKTTFAS